MPCVSSVERQGVERDGRGLVFKHPLQMSSEEIMFCDGCGAAVQPGQAFCGKCGKAIVGLVTALQMRPGRVQGHLQLLGIMWLAISAFNTIGAVILYCIANTLFRLHNLGAPQAPTAFAGSDLLLCRLHCRSDYFCCLFKRLLGEPRFLFSIKHLIGWRGKDIGFRTPARQVALPLEFVPSVRRRRGWK
jgi:hypothetical protein